MAATVQKSIRLPKEAVKENDSTVRLGVYYGQI